MTSKRGTVVKSVGGVFTVSCDDGKVVCFAPKKLRYFDMDVVVGDKVLFESIGHGKGVVKEILPRRNKLVRPEIANVDVCFIVLACEPQPDLYLCDKILINCFQEKIEPIIVVNKVDITENIVQVTRENYGNVAEIVCVSAFEQSASKLSAYIDDGKTACFAGQSAVGKTSLERTVARS